ncbi:hypothetical protein M3194_20665 [Paenibacillus glycanilyticus]|uniref:hypothetical protein n=1 Tax=Paenibacillus glycanilyticus TaxID=126569 RepID=UPI002041CDB4|nr:hypothetical protein [Paenibacillus glycanilyticus]MCM3629758.1 hypothetical protein [Paenibacillus glycanilyticus]
MGLLYEMVVKKKRSMLPSSPVHQTEQEEQEPNPLQAESILVHSPNELKDQNK